MPGMNSLPTDDNARVRDVRITEDELTVMLVDGRTLTVPLAWYPRLVNATGDQRNNWQLLADGEGIRWPDVDEDLSVAGLLRGNPAPPVAHLRGG